MKKFNDKKEFESALKLFNECEKSNNEMMSGAAGKSGCIEKEINIFESLIQPDTIGYTSMINSYSLNGMGFEVIELFNCMPSKLILEETYVCVLNACSHSRLVQQATNIFYNIINKTEQIYTTMVCLFNKHLLFSFHKFIF
ncbi:unnamed protein product [Adineta steineri]|uniref:Uncharacterized protein n=1 Tax=Adineta steineri TaxID=433720 RepID=A0A815FJD5_9BILA|nr:unnamed protein product [Adineta steineri]CAF1584231.1 unnamed protein product [Adineta steineri]